ncbi:MAG: aminopeptidase P family protein [Phycisphaerales bacterium]|nr:aminopeptidase P family protein [Phycisphaerales bacterium]
MQTALRVLNNLRGRMASLPGDQGGPLHAYIVPSSDDHQGEYVPDRWLRRARVSGFTGSMADAVVTPDRALLWADGRYWLQAEAQLDASLWTLMRSGERTTPSMQQWLADLPAGARVGVDPRLLAARTFEDIARALEKKGSRLVPVPTNLVDLDWTDAPPMPRSPVRVHPEVLAGKPAREKIADLRAAMAAKGADAHALSSLDAIAWLFNLRAADVPYNPVFLAYAIVADDDAALFTDLSRVGPEARRALEGVARLEEYSEFEPNVRAMAARRWWIDEAAASAHIVSLIGDPARIVERSRSPVTLAKARKNPAELAGMREAHRRDGAAMVRFLRWMFDAVPRGGQTETSIAARLEQFRAEDPRFIGPSFATIAGEGPNGAVIHYRPEPQTARPVGAGSHFLLDSGAQYEDGSTDITRAFHFGKAPDDHRDRATRVLQGMISVSRLRFPIGTTGLQIDAFARRFLWDAGLDYAHGTGHGIGAALSVHEWPPNISARPAAQVAIEPGMICSNEPGHYEAGRYGVRFENVLVAEPDPERPGFLRFETLTLCPFHPSLIDVDLLSPDERRWLDDYHAHVRGALTPLLEGEDLQWLERSTRPIARWAD